MPRHQDEIGLNIFSFLPCLQLNAGGVNSIHRKPYICVRRQYCCIFYEHRSGLERPSIKQSDGHTAKQQGKHSPLIFDLLLCNMVNDLPRLPLLALLSEYTMFVRSMWVHNCVCVCVRVRVCVCVCVCLETSCIK